MRFSRLLPLTALAALSVIADLHAQGSPDRSTHRTGFVVSGGARLHYLMWGSSGPTIVLLPGFSLTGHAFDDIAPLLAAGHRVIALTPRGFGESDAPNNSAYTIETLVGDLHVLLDSLHIDRAALVAHSISGTVATHFALRFQARVSHLILLDAFPYYGAMGGDSVSALDPVSPPAFQGDTTYDAAAVYLARYRYAPWRPALDADLRVKPLGAENARRQALTVKYIEDQWRHQPDMRKLSVPSLEVCSLVSVASEYPWLRTSDADYARAMSYITRHLVPFNQKLCKRFKDTVPRGRVVEVRGSHYVFFTQPEQTAGIVRRFLQNPR